jgi:hypothetical protein
VGLKHLNLQVASVETPGGSFSVRGLSLDDIIIIVRRHAVVLDGLFSRLRMSAESSLSLDDTGALVVLLVKEAPEAASEIIVLAARDAPDPDEGDLSIDEDELRIARSLPFPAQIDALEKIGKATFATEGSLKKVVETAVRVARSVTQAISALRT